MSKDNCSSLRNKGSLAPEEQDTNNSFVKKVRSRVSELIPSSLSRWFGSEGTKKAGVRLRDEDEDEDEQIQAPPLKRAKLPSSSSGNNYMTSGTFLPPRQAPSRSLFIRDDNIAGPSRGSNDVYNDDDKDSESGESTSGYSSMLKNTGTGDRKDAYDITNVINENQLFSSSNFGNDRTLFMDRSISSRANTSLSSRRPSFNASTFGTPSFVDRTLATQRIMKSPFYNGCTMYGGAAANNKPKTPKVYVKPINETAQNVNHSATLSKTARRILDTLEQYATDVNRIPHPLSDKRTLAAKYSGANPYIVREHRTPTTELQVPTVPDLLKMKLKQRLQDSTVAMRHIASTSKSAQDEYKTSKHTNKIKSKLTSIRRKPAVEDAPTSNLPEIQLQITTLPKFDLSFPLQSSSITKPVTVACSEPSQLPKTKILDVAAKSSDTAVQILPVKPKLQTNKTLETLTTPTVLVSPQERLEFKFADPLVLSENLKSIIAINNFKFSDPVIFDKLTSSDGFNFKLKNKVASKILENATSDLAKFKPASNTWECSTCLLRNLSDKIKCVACEAPKRTEDTKSKTSFGAEFKLSDDKWECTKCLVRNLNKDSVCVACSTPSQKLNGPITASFGGKFKPPSATWECLTCMIRNKDELDRCAACETLKTGNSTDKSQKPLDMFKMKSDQWECGVCMVRNSLEKTKCAACETPKPNTMQSEAKAAPVFKFGLFSNYKTAATEFIPTAASDKSTPSFSFGLKGTQSSDSLSKTPPQLVFGNKTVTTQSETSNTTFTFGVKSKVDAQAEPEPVKNAIQEDSKSSLKRMHETDPKDDASSLVSNPGKKNPTPITTTPSKKYFVSSPTAFSVPAVCKAVTNTSPVLSFKSPTTSVQPTFNITNSQSAAPSIFGTITSSPASSRIETQTKSLFETPNKSFQPVQTTPVLQTQPVTKTLFETPKQSFNTSMKFETPVPSKPAFEMPAPQPKSTFESPPPVFNSGFNTAPAFSFGALPKPAGFSFGAKPTESDKTIPAFNFGTTPSSGGFSFGTQAASSSTPTFNFNAPKTGPPSFQASTEPTKNIFEGVIPQGTLPIAPLQNGVFNFGATSVKTGFNFGTSTQSEPFAAPAATNPVPGMFNFGSSQPTPTTSGFNFGTTSAPNFNVEVKPSFNFTGGATPAFSALPPPNENPAVAHRRKIRAVRRNPQR